MRMATSVFHCLLVVAVIALAVAQSSNNESTKRRIQCRGSLSRPLSHRVFCLGQCRTRENATASPPRLKTVQQFLDACSELPDPQADDSEQSHNRQLVTETLRRNLSFSVEEGGQSMSVFILDFHLVSGDIYVDLKWSPGQQKPAPLVLNLVTKQFVTFRFTNVPPPASRVSLKVLINGEANVNFAEKRNERDESLVEIIHAPPYDRSDNRSDWVAFVEKATRSRLPIRRYSEHLTMLCHVSHVRLDLASMLRLASGAKSLKSNSPYLEIMEAFEDSDSSDYNVIKRCSIEGDESSKTKEGSAGAGSSRRLYNQESGPIPSVGFFQAVSASGNAYQEHLSNLMGAPRYNSPDRFIPPNVHQVYMLEIEQSEPTDKLLRIFVDECNIYEDYILILYISSSSSTKSNNSTGSNSKPAKKTIILDDYNCRIKVFSNTQVNDLLNEKISSSTLIDDVQANVNSSKAKASALKSKKVVNDVRLGLTQLLANVHNVSFDSFFYLKIISTANDVELSFFSNTNDRPHIASNKFFSKLAQQTFVDEEPSIKFVLSEIDLLDYFKSHYLDLGYFLEEQPPLPSGQHTRLLLGNNGSRRELDNRFFFVSDKRCSAIFLNKKLFFLDTYLLFFNSDMYNLGRDAPRCFIFENSTETLYATFGFTLAQDNFTNSVYFTLKKQLERPSQSSNKNPLSVPTSQTNTQREKPANEYFHNVLHNTVRLNYTVETRVEEASVGPELRVKIELSALDDSIAWRPNLCWLDDQICLNEFEATNSFDEETRDIDIGADDPDYYDELDNRIEHLSDSVEGNSNNNGSTRSAHNRKSRVLNQNQNEQHLLSYKLAAFSTQFEPPHHPDDRLYTFKASMTISLSSPINSRHKRFILCNLRAYPSCFSDAFVLDSNARNDTCKQTSPAVKYLEKKASTSKVMTIAVAKFQPNEPNELEIEFFLNSTLVLPVNAKSLCPFVANDSDRPTFSQKPTKTSKSSNNTLPARPDSLSAWLSSNRFTICLVSLLVVFLFGLSALVKLVFFKSNDYCLKLMPFKRRQRPQLSASKNVASCENAEQQLSLLAKPNGVVGGLKPEENGLLANQSNHTNNL